ncbi:MAG: hypothetical protein LBV06_09735 [Propionibacteriaceae bacterium]|jgi:plasmid stability protein|nr:hypothetical protein [Propionibacteriaceae bacterium]
MSMLQVRDLPAETHQALKVRAAQAGQSPSGYVATILNQAVAVPSMADFLDRLRLRSVIDPAVSAADILASERDQRP